MGPKRVLFVCTGNSCRSVMAEHLLRSLVQRAGREAIQVESAGVFAIGGMEPTRETQRILQDVGVDCSAHRTRALTAEQVEAAELILVMEQFQLDEIVDRFPSAKGKTHLLKPYGVDQPAAGQQLNIADPIGKPLEVYEVCFAEIREAVERLARSLLHDP